MSGHKMQYDFGPKRHWRRWVWNRIAERVANPRDALVVYLPGANNYDLPVAEDKGFRPLNMIGVERHAKTLEQLRDNGTLAVDADFFDSVDAISKNRRVDVVFADLCSGLDPCYANRLAIMIANPNMRGCIFAFNLMRGRDPKVNTMRADLEETCGKHRGAQLFSILNSDLSSGGVDVTRPQDEWWPQVARRAKFVEDKAAPVFTSYRSTALQTFDTVVFSNPLAGCREDIGFKQVMAKHDYYRQQKRAAAGRSAAAVLAIRTMKERGTFPTGRPPRRSGPSSSI